MPANSLPCESQPLTAPGGSGGCLRHHRWSRWDGGLKKYVHLDPVRVVSFGKGVIADVVTDLKMRSWIRVALNPGTSPAYEREKEKQTQAHGGKKPSEDGAGLGVWPQAKDA